VTVHTGDLDHAMMAALHSDTPHADSVSFRVLTRAEDGTPTLYRVTAVRAGTEFTSQATTPAEALKRAMQLLKAAAGGGWPTRVVEFATIEQTGEVTS
jgi:hypothetical protein